MTGRCPRVVIAGTHSGVGKTSLSVGLTGALTQKGLRVQTFKVGPDFLDPSYLALASGRPCYNLDGWMTSREYVAQLFVRATEDADICVIEGVMGMFDGASPASLEGSTAEIAIWLDAPLLLVADAHGMAGSIAAVVKGFVEFERRARIGGVIVNRSGSERHKELLTESLECAGLPRLVGAIPEGSLPRLRSRHLGLITADEHTVPSKVIGQLADACRRHLDIEAIVATAHSVSEMVATPTTTDPPGQDVRIGIARDRAFHFYYPDNLEMLERLGAELVTFSPLADQALPAGLDGLYCGGGYPEAYAEPLSDNGSMLVSIRSFAASGRPLYAECGGLMYLSKAVETMDGKEFPMANVLPVATKMQPRLTSLGYAEVELAEDSIWGKRGTTFRGHEFHYSEVVGPSPADLGWRTAYSVRRKSSADTTAEGFQKGCVLASYVHLHFASQPGTAEYFLEKCRETSSNEVIS